MEQRNSQESWFDCPPPLTYQKQTLQFSVVLWATCSQNPIFLLNICITYDDIHNSTEMKDSPQLQTAHSTLSLSPKHTYYCMAIFFGWKGSLGDSWWSFDGRKEETWHFNGKTCKLFCGLSEDSAKSIFSLCWGLQSIYYYMASSFSYECRRPLFERVSLILSQVGKVQCRNSHKMCNSGNRKKGYAWPVVDGVW